jgi:hypothetical protein
MSKGIAASGDILVRTRDGQDLNAIWNGFRDILDTFNAARQPLIDLLSYSVTDVIEDIVEAGTERFEQASEFGLPKSIRSAPVVNQRAFPFTWYDLRQSYTFQFLAGNGNTAGATSAQIDSVLQMAMEADNRLQFEQVMKSLFNSANRSTNVFNTAYSVTALYNADSMFIPPYNGVSFNRATHTHYVNSGAATLDSTDLDQLALLVTEHGYDRANGYTTIILANATETAVIKTFRRGSTNNNAQVAVYDFIPATGTGFLLPVGWEVAGGSQPGPTFAGMNVIGSYGPYLIVENGNIPSGYLVAAASQGRSSNLNIVGIREHPDASLRGLVIKPGNNANYPIIDSMFIRGLGAAVARRGAAAVMSVGAGAYSVPAQYAWSA